MNYSDIERALAEAKQTIRAMELQTPALARLIAGRLRCIPTEVNYSNRETLAALKRELSQYNAKTGKWKS